MRLLLALGVAGTLLLGGCRSSARDGKADDASAGNGQGLVISFARKHVVWAEIRATPEARAAGWRGPLKSAVYVLYPQRGFNPAFTGGARIRVVWLDGGRVVKVEDSGEARHVSPPQEVTAALLFPEGVEPGFQPGDQLKLVEDR